MQILILRNDFLKNIDYTDEFLRKRKERQKRARKRRLIASFTFFVVFLLLVGVILSLTVLFPINKLNISGSKIYTSEQISDACGIDLGDNLFTVSKKDTLNKLKEKLPFIETVEFKRTLPDTLKITVTDAKKYACYEIDGKFYTVSKGGWVLEKTSEKAENVFLVVANGVKCKVGESIKFKNQETKQQIELLVEALNQEKVSIDYINVTDNVNLIAGVDARFEVEFGTENSLDSKIKHLKSMIDNIEETKSGRINLSMWNKQNPQGTFVQNNTK